jgi:uncharacterized membrane protein
MEEMIMAVQKIVCDPQDIEKNKVYAVLAYIGILFLVPLLAAKDSPYAKFHTNQGLVLFLLEVALSVISWIPVLGWIVGVVGWIAVAVFLIMGIVNAAQGECKPLPIIGEIEIIK